MVKNAVFHLFLLVSLAVLSTSCADPKSVNAAFSQTRVSWFLFDADQDDGLRPLAGFEQAQKVVWRPRNRAVFATDLAPAPGKPGAVAVAGLGLLLLDDGDGTLTAVRPGAQLPLTVYRTERLFTWNGKLFVTLAQEVPADSVPATLAWWAPGQSRLALYPIPSQVRDSSRQAVAVDPPVPGSDSVAFTWILKAGEGWAFERSSLDLSNGAEGEASPTLPASPLGEEYDAVKARLLERLGTGIPYRAARGPGTFVLYTEAGWVSIGRSGEGRARLYRLPDLGQAGRYSGALALNRGFVFTWETVYRGYAGAAGLVHVPFAVLAP